eukprot:TRINITY_DN8501_c0_g1_i1.p1 TRINITY_DN8501_c0_g1~~TRINITY_DN8501_c0_g1_i1.p1  ORF type:complete len:160 (-),score=26.21 TRINITY_DN8501_c0_g1_i1:36-515(-)
MAKYLSLISLCHIATDEKHTQRVKDENGLEYLPIFLKRYTPEDMREIERSKGFIWTFMKQFQLLTETDDVVINRFGTFCLANLSYLDLNRAAMEKEGLTNQIFCLIWSHDPDTKEYAQTIKKNFGPQFQIPRLYNLARHVIIQYNIGKKNEDKIICKWN